MESSARSTPDTTSRVDTLGVLTGEWKTIVKWTLAVTVLAAIVSLFIPKTYRAEAVLLINPSPYKSSSLEQTPLEVDTYEKLVRSPALIEEVKKQLGLDALVEELRNKMTVVTTKRPSQRETTYAPMLLLQVEDRRPAQCEAIANAWADLATSASWRIKSEVILQANERIRKQHEDTKTKLEKQEDALKLFDTTARLIERKAELELLRTQLAAEQDNLEGLRLQSGVAQTRVEDLKRKYASFFFNGVWVGALQGTTNGVTAALTSAKIDPLAQQLLLARNDLVAKTREYVDFKSKKSVDIKKREYDILIDKVDRFETDVEQLRLALATNRAKVQDLETQLRTVPERLSVRRSITEEGLRAAPNRKGSGDEATSTRLVSDEINPLWLSLQGRLQYVRPDVAVAEASVKLQEASLKQLREEQNKLDGEIVTLTQGAKDRENEMQMARDRYDALFQQFLRISHDIMSQEGDAARLKEEITNSQSQVARLTSATVELTSYTVARDLDRERLQRDLSSVKNIYTLLATRVEEARITELEVSGDLQVAFRAVPPQDKIKPKRSQIVGAAFLCALVMFSLLAIAREHLRREAA